MNLVESNKLQFNQDITSNKDLTQGLRPLTITIFTPLDKLQKIMQIKSSFLLRLLQKKERSKVSPNDQALLHISQDLITFQLTLMLKKFISRFNTSSSLSNTPREEATIKKIGMSLIPNLLIEMITRNILNLRLQ